VALGEVEVVERLEAEIRAVSDLAQGDVVLLGLAVGRLRIWQVGQRDEQLLASRIELLELRLELLELRLEGTRALAQLCELGLVDLAGLGRLLDLSRELVLVGPDGVRPGVELASALIDRDQLVELFGRPAPRQRRADPVGVGADLLQVERGSVPAS
jgi:hypothetical protein